jgi:hypothetical protein
VPQSRTCRTVEAITVHRTYFIYHSTPASQGEGECRKAEHVAQLIIRHLLRNLLRKARASAAKPNMSNSKGTFSNHHIITFSNQLIS